MTALTHTILSASHSQDSDPPDHIGPMMKISKPLSFHNPVPSQEPPISSWDTRAACIHLAPAFHYISRKLAKRRVQIVFVVTNYGEGIMPAQPIPRSAQTMLLKIIIKACSIFQFGPSWMTALAKASNKRSSRDLFELSRFDPYLIHRSLIQNEPIFLGEGLTLLSIDHIFTFKHSVAALSGMNRVSLSWVVCMTSCVELLHEINTIYTGRKPRKAYFLRVYDYIQINEETLDEVMATYESKHGRFDHIFQVTLLEEEGRNCDTSILPAETKSPSVVSFPEKTYLETPPHNCESPNSFADNESTSQPTSPWDSILAELFPPSATYPQRRSYYTALSDGVRDPPPPPLPSYPLRARNSGCTSQEPSSDEDETTTTTILGSEWESFRRIGLGLYTA